MSSGDSSGPASAGIPVIITEPFWRRVIPCAERVANRAARAVGAPISVVLSNDRTVRRLNAAHRGRNKPTNVLTYDPPAPGLPGDVIVALGTVCREAAAAGRRPVHHLAHLIVHGGLHLQGHDHIQVGDARRMEMAEARLLRRMGVPNPWKRA